MVDLRVTAAGTAGARLGAVFPATRSSRLVRGRPHAARVVYDRAVSTRARPHTLCSPDRQAPDLGARLPRSRLDPGVFAARRVERPATPRSYDVFDNAGADGAAEVVPVVALSSHRQGSSRPRSDAHPDRLEMETS